MNSSLFMKHFYNNKEEIWENILYHCSCVDISKMFLLCILIISNQSLFMGNKYFPHPMSSLCKPCLPSTPNLLFKINDWSRILKKTGTHNLVIFPFLLHMWQQLGWDKNHRIKVKYKRRIDETSHGFGKSTKLSSAASRCNTSRFLNLDTGLSFLRRSATLRKQWRVTRSTIP